jgi:hypothetical protein
MKRLDRRDYTLFTNTILMIASSSRLAREEIDNLITTRTIRGRWFLSLLRTRPSVAALESIAHHLDEGERL